MKDIVGEGTARARKIAEQVREDVELARTAFTRPRVQKVFKKPSLTRQEFREQCDLGKTIERFRKTPEGRLALAKAQGVVGGQFLDVSGVPDYRTALDNVSRANEAFMRLPALVRRRFGNDPALFLDFCSDPRNSDELIKLGLAERRVNAVAKPVKGADAPSPAAG